MTDGSGVWNTTAGNTVWWDGATNTIWSNSGPNDAVFGNRNGAAGTGTIGSAITVGNLTFNPAGSGNYALTAANDSNSLTFAVATPTITTNASATVGARVVSGGGFVKEGLGTLTLRGSNAGGTQNAIGGTITVNAGALVLGGSLGFGGGFQGNLTVANFGRFYVAQGIALYNSSGQITFGADAYAELRDNEFGALAGSGRVTLASDVALRSGTQDFAGVISGPGRIFLSSGSGAHQTLSGANLYTGDTLIQGGAGNSLTLNNVNALQSSTLTGVFSATKLVFGLAGTNTYNLGALGGAGSISLGSNTISVGASNLGALSDAVITGSGGLTKLGTNSQGLRGASTYTGATTIGGGTIQLQGGGALSTSSPITFTGSGGFSINGGLRTVGALTRTAGNATITSTHDGANTSLTFSSLAARTAGATANFVASSGTNGTTNKIVLTGATPNAFIDHGSFFGGNNFAWNDAGGYVRALAYGSDAGAVSAAGGLSLASAAHQETTAPVTAQTDATFTTLKITGAHAFTLAGAQTVTLDGLLKTGANANLSGGAGIRASSGQDLVVRTHAEADALMINTPILANGSNALAKAGLGSLTLGASAVNTYTGGTFVNEGTLIVVQDSNFGSTAAANNIALNGGTLQPSASFALHANHGIDIGPAGGTLYGVGFGITLGSANMLSGSGPLAITGDPTTVPVLTSAATQDFTGRMTIGVSSFFRAQIALGADNLTNPFGTGDITVVTGAGSAVYVNRPGSVWNNRFYLSGNGADNRGVIRTQQGGTFHGDIILADHASISSDGVGTTTTLNGNISGAFTLTLGGRTGANAANQYVLTGNNVHSATTVGLGITRIDRDVALGAYDGTTTIQSGATLQAGASGIILNPDRTIALTGGGLHSLDADIYGLVVQGSITGAASDTLVLRGNHIRLSAASSYAGATVIEGSTVAVDSLANAGLPSSLGQGSPAPSSADLILRDATLQAVAGGTTNRVFTIEGTATVESSAALPQDPTRFLNPGAIGLAGTAPRLVLGGTNTGANTFTPTLGDAGTPQDPIRTGLTKTGPGTWIVDGLNTYTGVTRIHGGILNVATLANNGVASSIGLGSVAIPQDPYRLVIAGGTLQHTAANIASTDRLFTIGDASATTATLDSSALSPQDPVRFLNPGALGLGGTAPIGWCSAARIRERTSSPPASAMLASRRSRSAPASPRRARAHGSSPA